MRDAIFALLRALFWGAVAGGGPFLLLTVPISITGIGEGPVGGMILVALMPILVAGAVTALAILILGLPLTALLVRLERESRGLYVVAGCALGLLLTLGATLYIGDGRSGTFLGIFGAAAGSAAAGSWGGWREKVAASRPEQAPEG